MSQQHRYTAAEVVTQNVGRAEQIILRPGHATVEVVYAIGEENAGVFVENEKAHRLVAYADLPAPVRAVLEDLETKALSYGVTSGALPAGAVEPVPVPVPVPDP